MAYLYNRIARGENVSFLYYLQGEDYSVRGWGPLDQLPYITKRQYLVKKSSPSVQMRQVLSPTMPFPTLLSLKKDWSQPPALLSLVPTRRIYALLCSCSSHHWSWAPSIGKGRRNPWLPWLSWFHLQSTLNLGSYCPESQLYYCSSSTDYGPSRCSRETVAELCAICQ